MRIEAVDRGDDLALRRWYDVLRAGTAYGRDDPPMWQLPEIVAALRRPDPVFEYEIYAAVEGEDVVGGLSLDLPLQDNTRIVDIWLAVAPEQRNRGVGAALWDHAVARTRALGRSILQTAVEQPIGAEPQPGIAFVTARGLTLRNVEILRHAPLPIPAERLAALAAHAAERAAGYRLESWQGACPERYAEQYARLKAHLSTDAPSGELALEPEVWDVDRLRASEAMTTAQGRTVLTTVALGGNSELAGHTQISTAEHEPGHCYQWDTLVLRAHRGHRLGLALKTANHARLAESYPELTRISTWNAAQNGPMIAINETMGYRPVEETQEWQREL